MTALRHTHRLHCLGHDNALKRFLYFLLGWLICGEAIALDPKLTLAQFHHVSWTQKERGLADVNVFVQHPDGRLLFGASQGLYNFDSVTFRNAVPWGKLKSNNISALHAAGSGTIWMGFANGGVNSHDPNSELSQHYDEKDGIPAGSVHAIVGGLDGKIWLAADGGLASFIGDRWQRSDPSDGLPQGPALGAFLDRSGTLWVALQDALFALPAGQKAFRRVGDLSGQAFRTRHFAQAPDGSVWVTSPGDGLRRVYPSSTVLQRWLADPRVGPIVFDRDGNLWLAGETLRRVVEPSTLESMSVAEASTRVEHLTRVQGLSSDAVRTVFEDRAGSIWIATDAGLDRLDHDFIVKVPLPGGPGGSKTIVAGDDGKVWVAHSRGPSVLRLESGKVTAAYPAPTFTAGLRDRNGGIWFGGPTGLAQVQDKGLQVTPLPPEARGFDVQAMAQDTAGAIWVSVDRVGVYRFRAGAWAQDANPAGLPNGWALSMTADQQGALWLGYPNGRLVRVAGDDITSFGAVDGLSIGPVTALHARNGFVWIGGEVGLAVHDGSRIRGLDNRSCGQFMNISGAAETDSGDLWLPRYRGLTRIKAARQQLQELSTDGKLRCSGEGRASTPGEPQQLRPTPSLVRASDDRLWFATTDALAWLDFSRLGRIAGPTAVSIRYFESQSSGGWENRKWHPLNGARLPQGTKQIRIEYTAWSTLSAYTTSFRYRIEGPQEASQWREVGPQRELSIDNLGPGIHRIFVSASTDRFSWSEPPAKLEFEILPAFYQTTAFKAACALAGLALAWMGYRLQLKRATDRVRALFEERIIERERIARELHDTLLQGTQALIMRVHTAMEQMPERDPVRGRLELSLESADSTLIESRDRIKDLRQESSDQADFLSDLNALAKRLAVDSGVEVRVRAHGAAHTLQRITGEEILLIVREALANALAHAHASQISVDVFYQPVELRLTITDNGCGINPEILRAGGRAGHWGLRGMQERAKSLRGSLDFKSEFNAGSKVELRIPGALAYVGRPRRSTRFFPIAWRWARRRGGGIEKDAR